MTQGAHHLSISRSCVGLRPRTSLAHEGGGLRYAVAPQVLSARGPFGAGFRKARPNTSGMRPWASMRPAGPAFAGTDSRQSPSDRTASPLTALSRASGGRADAALLPRSRPLNVRAAPLDPAGLPEEPRGLALAEPAQDRVQRLAAFEAARRDIEHFRFHACALQPHREGAGPWRG